MRSSRQYSRDRKTGQEVSGNNVGSYRTNQGDVSTSYN